MKEKLKGVVIAVVAIAALAVGGAAIAGAAGGDDDDTDKAISGPAFDRAKAVALEHTGGGKVTGSEVGDEEGAYEVEVVKPDGSQVDVHLDKGFNLIDQADDGGGEVDQGGENESGEDD